MWDICFMFFLCCHLVPADLFPTQVPQPDFDEAPPWLQALRLLEEAARPRGLRDAAGAAKAEAQRAEGDTVPSGSKGGELREFGTIFFGGFKML